MSEARLREGFVRLGLTSADADIPKLLILKEFFRFYGRSMNLTSSLDDAALDEHVLEGLQVVALARQLGISGAWLDVGSGGGFPGLVLAACLDNDLTLVEPRAKRASVLELGLGKLRRRNARVVRGRVDAGKFVGMERATIEPGFVAASARAVFEPRRWIDEATPWLAADGVIIVHVGVGEDLPGEVVGRVEGPRWGIVGLRRVPRGTSEPAD